MNRRGTDRNIYRWTGVCFRDNVLKILYLSSISSIGRPQIRTSQEKKDLLKLRYFFRTTSGVTDRQTDICIDIQTMYEHKNSRGMPTDPKHIQQHCSINIKYAYTPVTRPLNMASTDFSMAPNASCVAYYFHSFDFHIEEDDAKLFSFFM